MLIIVSGTKRSGTSMWMQVLRAAGCAVLGDAFPRDWARTIRAANERGFFECPLRHGIRQGKSRHPGTGALLSAGETRGLVVKVFAAGLAKTDLVYIDKVIASMRHWREYAASLERLYAMEQTNKLTLAQRRGHSREVLPSLAHPPAVLEWWNDNYTLIRDARVRGYPVRWVSYAAVLRDASREVGASLRWLGQGDATAAITAVQGELRTQRADVQLRAGNALARDQERLFDELYAHVDQEVMWNAAFAARLEAMQQCLAPQVRAAQSWASQERKRVRDAARAALAMPPSRRSGRLHAPGKR